MHVCKHEVVIRTEYICTSFDTHATFDSCPNFNYYSVCTNCYIQTKHKAYDSGSSDITKYDWY